MLPAEFVQAWRNHDSSMPDEDLLTLVRYHPQSASVVGDAGIANRSMAESDCIEKIKIEKSEETQEAEEEDDIDDLNEDFRDSVCAELSADLRLSDVALLRFLLEQYILSHQASWGFAEGMHLCASLLSRLGHVEDALLLWKAKETSFDTNCGLEIQLLTGAGLEQTLTFLDSQDSAAAQEAATALRAAYHLT